MALFDPADFGGGGNGWLPFEDRWAPQEDAIQKGVYAQPGDSRFPGMPDSMVNARMFPGYGSNMPQPQPMNTQYASMPMGEPQGGPQMPQGGPPQGMPQPLPAPIVMPSVGGMAPGLGAQPPGIGDRIQAAGAGFFNAGSLPQAIGNLIGGAITGQRQDPYGIAMQMHGQSQEVARQEQGAMYQALRDEGVPHSQAVATALNPAAMNKWRELHLKENDFKVVPWGSTALNKKGEVVYSAAGEGNGLLDEKTLKTMAEQARSGDTSVFQNLGRGAQGAENIVRLRTEIARQNSEAGTSGTEQANRNFEAFGVKAGQRTLGTKQANIELAATEFKQVLPIVQKASMEVNRTQYPDLNKVIQMWQEKTGDPKIVAFGGGINTLVNLYSRAISPTGTPTVSDKDHAREILVKAWSQGQFDAAVKMMNTEIDAAMEAPGAVREHMRQRFQEGMQPAKPKAAPSNNGWSIQRLP